jgi:hypothetical protein
VHDGVLEALGLHRASPAHPSSLSRDDTRCSFALPSWKPGKKALKLYAEVGLARPADGSRCQLRRSAIGRAKRGFRPVLPLPSCARPYSTPS